MTLARTLLHMQMKELEDALTSARQSSAQLQAQLDAASASAQSQATDLICAQAQVSELRAESQSLQSQLSEAQRDWQAAQETCQTKEAATADQAQQWTVKVCAVVCTHDWCLVQACLPSNSSKQQRCCSHPLQDYSELCRAILQCSCCTVGMPVCSWPVARNHKHAINTLAMCMY